MSQGDGYGEVSYESWFSRIGKSIMGILVGIVLFLVSIILLWVNEGWAVQAAEGLAEGKGAVVSLDEPKVDAANEGKLVHVTGEAETDATLEDPKFQVAVPHAIRLERHIEIYQWQEEKKTKTEKQIGGGTKKTTTPDYKQIWSAQPISSSEFMEAKTHRNTGAMPAPQESWKAKKVTLGEFTLPPALFEKMESNKLDMTKEMAAKLPEDVQEEFPVKNGYLYKSKSGSGEGPAIGDVRIWYTVIQPAEVSLIAEQSKETFRPYHTKAKTDLFRLSMGNKSAATMLDEAQAESTALTWILRLVGWIVMGIGIFLVFRPLVVLSDIIPFLGDMTAGVVGVFAALVSLVLSLLIIAVAWLFYRPILGIGLLVGAAVVTAGVIFLVRSRPKKQLSKG